MKHQQDFAMNQKTIIQSLADNQIRLALLDASLQEDLAAKQYYESLDQDHPDRRQLELFMDKAREHNLNLLKNQRRPAKIRQFKHIIPKLIKAAAIFLTVSALGLATAMAISPELRIQVLKLLINITPSYTQIIMEPRGDHLLSVPSEWGGNYYPSYIPEGYRFYAVSGEHPVRTTIYMAGDEKMLDFSEYSGTVVTHTDTEGYTLSEIELNGTIATLAEKEGKTKLIWAIADRYFILIITENAETAIKIAKSVEYIQNN
ncbi:MAG: DUF4367 domain-containing protein [Christensenellales bacterium]|jgi:hypothetical protein